MSPAPSSTGSIALGVGEEAGAPGDAVPLDETEAAAAEAELPPSAEAGAWPERDEPPVDGPDADALDRGGADCTTNELSPNSSASVARNATAPSATWRAVP
jgi:hypothetical protein